MQLPKHDLDHGVGRPSGLCARHKYRSLSAMMVAVFLPFLWYGALPAASHEPRSLPLPERLGPSPPSARSTASEMAAQQSRGAIRLAQQSHEAQASPQEEPQHSTAPAQQEGAASPAAPAEPQPQAEQTTGSHPGVDIVLHGGKVEAVLNLEFTELSEPKSPTSEFPEGEYSPSESIASVTLKFF